MLTKRKPLIAGNWKLNGSLAGNANLLNAILSGGGDAGGRVSVVVCPAFPHLAQVQALLAGTPVAWGAQNVCEQAGGAFTGEVSVDMLRDFACSYVILGHSERRSLYGETDLQVAAKTERVLAGGMTPIVCVGETLSQREANETLSVVGAQLDAVLARVGTTDVAKLVVAYEPVWAIGTGRTATPAQVQEVHAAIRSQLAKANAASAVEVRILYGGSVKPSNAAEIFSMGDVDGGLIGGAALIADDFLAICAAVAQAKAA